MANKYEFTDETQTLLEGQVLHRIRALRDIPEIGVKAGDLGGWIEKEENLSQEGSCWVGKDAMVWDKAVVSEDAQILDYAQVCGCALVYGYAKLKNYTKVCDAAEVYGRAVVMDHAMICDAAKIYGQGIVSGFARIGFASRIY